MGERQLPQLISPPDDTLFEQQIYRLFARHYSSLTE